MAGWQTKTLSEVAYTAGRIGWKGLTAKEYTESGPYFLSVHSLNYGDIVDFRDAFHISDARYEESPEIMIEPEDILICKDGAGIGKVGIVGGIPGPATINSSLLLIRANKGIEPKFLYYKLCSPSFQRIVQERIEGATTPHLYQREINQFLISFPDVPEQKRIVAILDQAFADIDQARALTEQNLKNARELFESYLQQVFSQRGEGWMIKTLSDVSENLDSKRVPITKRDRLEGDYPYYGASGIVDYIDSYIFDEDLLLVSEDGANLLARTYPIAFSATGKYWVNNHAHVLKFENQWIQKFTEYYLNSISLEPYVSGMAQPKLNQRALNSIPVPSVSSEIAQNVVLKLTKLELELNKIQVIYREKLQRLGALKKSLLQKAFSGQLTKTNESA